MKLPPEIKEEIIKYVYWNQIKDTLIRALDSDDQQRHEIMVIELVEVSVFCEEFLDRKFMLHADDIVKIIFFMGECLFTSRVVYYPMSLRDKCQDLVASFVGKEMLNEKAELQFLMSTLRWNDLEVRYFHQE